MRKETKAFLEILIYEIQSCGNSNEINTLLDSWIKANNLHPERVITISKEELPQFLKKMGIKL